MTEQIRLCSFELCKMLKENNIKVPFEYYFDDSGIHRLGETELPVDYYPCPSPLDVLIWFHKNRSVTVSVNMGIYAKEEGDESKLHWDYDVVEFSDERLDYPFDVSYGYDSYEKALDDGLKILTNTYA